MKKIMKTMAIVLGSSVAIGSVALEANAYIRGSVPFITTCINTPSVNNFVSWDKTSGKPLQYVIVSDANIADATNSIEYPDRKIFPLVAPPLIGGKIPGSAGAKGSYPIGGEAGWIFLYNKTGYSLGVRCQLP